MSSMTPPHLLKNSPRFQVTGLPFTNAAQATLHSDHYSFVVFPPYSSPSEELLLQIAQEQIALFPGPIANEVS